MKSMILKWAISTGALLSPLLLASNALAYPFDLQVRATSIPNSCDYGVFQPELKISNVQTFDVALSSVFVELGFYANANQIQAIYPRINVPIFNSSNSVVSYTAASVVKRPALSATFSSTRRTNEVWGVIFDPPSPPPAASNLIPPGGYALLTPALWRGGATPFDVGCDDFTKVDRGLSSSTFVDNQFYHLLFTSTQQLICEQKSPTVNDPLSGFAFTGPVTGCP